MSNFINNPYAGKPITRQTSHTAHAAKSLITISRMDEFQDFLRLNSTKGTGNVSIKIGNSDVWEEKYFIFDEGVLKYGPSATADASQFVTIAMDQVVSVRADSTHGGSTIRIATTEQKYYLKLRSENEMVNLLFSFQKSVALVLSHLLTESDRLKRLSSNNSRDESLVWSEELGHGHGHGHGRNHRASAGGNGPAFYRMPSRNGSGHNSPGKFAGGLAGTGGPGAMLGVYSNNTSTNQSVADSPSNPFSHNHGGGGGRPMYMGTYGGFGYNEQQQAGMDSFQARYGQQNPHAHSNIPHSGSSNSSSSGYPLHTQTSLDRQHSPHLYQAGVASGFRSYSTNSDGAMGGGPSFDMRQLAAAAEGAGMPSQQPRGGIAAALAGTSSAGGGSSSAHSPLIHSGTLSPAAMQQSSPSYNNMGTHSTGFTSQLSRSIGNTAGYMHSQPGNVNVTPVAGTSIAAGTSYHRSRDSQSHDREGGASRETRADSRGDRDARASRSNSTNTRSTSVEKLATSYKDDDESLIRLEALLCGTDSDGGSRRESDNEDNDFDDPEDEEDSIQDRGDDDDDMMFDLDETHAIRNSQAELQRIQQSKLKSASSTSEGILGTNSHTGSASAYSSHNNSARDVRHSHGSASGVSGGLPVGAIAGAGGGDGHDFYSFGKALSLSLSLADGGQPSGGSASSRTPKSGENTSTGGGSSSHLSPNRSKSSSENPTPKHADGRAHSSDGSGRAGLSQPISIPVNALSPMTRNRSTSHSSTGSGTGSGTEGGGGGGGGSCHPLHAAARNALNAESAADLLAGGRPITTENHTKHLMWESGYCSLIGIREKQEDRFACTPNIHDRATVPTSSAPAPAPSSSSSSSNSPQRGGGSAGATGYFGVFDGHSGFEAAAYLQDHLLNNICAHPTFVSNLERAVTETCVQTDAAFLSLCDSKKWYCGTTAIGAFIVDSQLLVFSIGDCQAVLCSDGKAVEMNNPHKPGRPDEVERIRRAGGWITDEKELYMARLHRMDLSDPFVRERAEKVTWVQITRVCGEMSVSRSIGDPDYKRITPGITGNAFFLWPQDHDQIFHADLLIPEPECMQRALLPVDEFLILASDGLWDVVSPSEAVTLVKNAFHRGQTPSEAADYPCKLSIKLGSSDNVTVVITRFIHSSL